MSRVLNTCVQRLTLSVGIVIAVMLISCKSEQAGAENMVQNTEKSTTSISAADSLELAKRIQSLKELQLPDEWEYAEGKTLAERFDATAKLMKKENPDAPTGAELMQKYENGGRPFVHSIWFNRPLSCDKCQDAGADGYFTIVSVKQGLFVTVTAEEMHMVTKHQGVFPEEKFNILKKILADASGS